MNKTTIFKLLVLITLVSYIFSVRLITNEVLIKSDIKDRYKSMGNSSSGNSTANSTSTSSPSNSSSSTSSSSATPSSSTSSASTNPSTTSSNSTNSTNNTSPNNTNNEYKEAKVINPSTPSGLVQKNDFYNCNFKCEKDLLFDQYSGTCVKGVNGQAPPNDFTLMQGIHKGTNIEYVDRYKGYKTPTIVNQIGADWKYYDRKAGSVLK